MDVGGISITPLVENVQMPRGGGIRDDTRRGSDSIIFQASDPTQSPAESYVCVFGAGVADTVTVSGDSIVYDGQSAYTVAAGTASIHIRDASGDDTLGADPADIDATTLPLWLFGGCGSNTLIGGGGDNLIVGGTGSNVIHCGGGFSSPEIVDNSDTRAAFPSISNFYHEGVGTNDTAWTDDANGRGFNQGQREHAASSNADTQAVWTFDNLDPGEYYDVYVTWSPEAGASTAAQYNVFDDGTLLATPPTVNQTQAPADDEAAGVFWHELGLYQAGSGTLIVKLGADMSGTVLADAARLVAYGAAPATSMTMNNFDIDSSGNLAVTYTIAGGMPRPSASASTSRPTASSRPRSWARSTSATRPTWPAAAPSIRSSTTAASTG